VKVFFGVLLFSEKWKICYVGRIKEQGERWQRDGAN
jgi:hypothetical protein